MRIRSLFFLGWLIAATTAFAAQLANVPVLLGPIFLAEGDALVIEQVLSTSPKLDIGDTVVVRGKYTLRSQSEAKLGVSLTQTANAQPTPISAAANRMVSRGSGEFELVFEVRSIGCLNVSLSNVRGGKFFSRVYFGTAEQIERVRGIRP
jgi:hypothetical protein